ncbi:MAG: hypothetical protein JRE73_13570 [Deltaproteobacteria bacterium]|nr:hypothetical protein [Deltaproteobacteria bacterium]
MIAPGRSRRARKEATASRWWSDDQEDKIPILADIRKLLLDSRKYVDDEDLAEIDEHIPPESIKPLTYSDVPVEVATMFAEKDGVRGRILVVTQREGFSTWDGRYLIRWSEGLRALRTESRERPALAGRAPVFADMISAIWTDGPKAILAKQSWLLSLRHCCWCCLHLETYVNASSPWPHCCWGLPGWQAQWRLRG